MAAPLNCSNILYDKSFDTSYDHTVSFTYTLSSDGVHLNDDGFAVFFVSGSTATLTGGGYGAGLGVASNASNISGIILTVGFDILGNFVKSGSITPFTTGLASATPLSIGVRSGSGFRYTGSTDISTTSPALLSVNTEQTIRVGIRKNFQTVDVYRLVNQSYEKLTTLNTGLTSVAAGLTSTAKFGISYSGDSAFVVKNITVNCKE